VSNAHDSSSLQQIKSEERSNLLHDYNKRYLDLRNSMNHKYVTYGVRGAVTGSLLGGLVVSVATLKEAEFIYPFLAAFTIPFFLSLFLAGKNLENIRSEATALQKTINSLEVLQNENCK
jgi:hypothetical protein